MPTITSWTSITKMKDLLLKCNTSQNDGTKRLQNIFQIYHSNNIRISFPVIRLLDQNVGNAVEAFPRKNVEKWIEPVCICFSLWSLSSLWLIICLQSMVSMFQLCLQFMVSMVYHIFTFHGLYGPIMFTLYSLYVQSYVYSLCSL